MSVYDIKCRIIEEELKTFWPQWHVVKRLGGGSFGDVFQIYGDKYGIRVESALKVIQISDETETSILIPVSQGILEGDKQKTSDTAGVFNKNLHEEHFQSGKKAVYGDPETIPEDLRNEIKIMEALRGAPNIVVIEDFHCKKEGTTNSLFVRMELLSSFQEILHNRLKNQELFSQQEVLKIGRDVCTALMYCEKKGIIHRDLKPANLFVDEFGNFKVGDFGVSKRLDTVHLAHTMTGVGTISYMAPEIYRGQSYNNTVDIYALGLILYQLLNGCRIPFLQASGSYNACDIDSANYRRLHGDPVPSLAGMPTGFGDETVDPALDAILRKAFAPQIGDRYQTAVEFYQALDSWENAQSSEGNILQGYVQGGEQNTVKKPLQGGFRQNDRREPAQGFGAECRKNISRDTVRKSGNNHEYVRQTEKRKSFIWLIPLVMLILLLLGGGAAINRMIREQTARTGSSVFPDSDSLASSNDSLQNEDLQNKDLQNEDTDGGRVGEEELEEEKKVEPASGYLQGVVTDSWEEIAAAGENGTYADKYSIGDQKELDLGDEGLIRMELVAMDADELADGSGKAHMTWVAKDLIRSDHYMNPTDTNEGGWQESDIRSWLHESILPLFPETVRANIKEVTKYSYSRTENGTVASQDMIWIPSVRETLGGDSWEDCGPDYTAVFLEDEGRHKYHPGNSAPSWWWLRSASSRRTGIFSSVHYYGGRFGDYASKELGVAIGFCL